MELFVDGTNCWASAHAEVVDSRGIGYEEDELTSLGEFTNTSQGDVDLHDLITDLPATTLLSFFSIGTALEREYGIDCYVGRLIGPNEVVFTIKEHPIVSGVARRDEKMLAIYRVTPPFHTGAVCDHLPFNYPTGVVEVEVSTNPPGAWLSAEMARTTTYQKLVIFFLYARP